MRGARPRSPNDYRVTLSSPISVCASMSDLSGIYASCHCMETPEAPSSSHERRGLELGEVERQTLRSYRREHNEESREIVDQHLQGFAPGVARSCAGDRW